MVDLHLLNIQKLKNNAPDLTEVIFGDRDGGKTDNLEFMARILAVNTSLRSYSLCRFHLGSAYPQFQVQEGFAEVTAALKNNKTLEIFNLNYHVLSDDDMAALADMLAVNDTLIELNLNKCSISGQGLKLLAQGLAANKALKRIHLRMNGIGTDISALEALSKALQQNTSIVNLDLWDNNITYENVTFLQEILRHNKTLKALNLGFNTFLRDEGVIALAEALKFNTTINELYLQCTNIGPTGAVALADAISNHSALTVLDLGSNKIEPEGAAAFAAVIKNHQSLVKLDINNCYIGDIGAKAFAIALMSGNNILAELNLINNEITQASLRFLKELIKTNQHLATLDLAANKLGIKAIKELSETIASNTTLKKVALHNTCEKRVKSPEVITAFTNIVENNKTLTTFHFDRGKINCGEITSELDNALTTNETQTFLLIDAVYKGDIKTAQQLLENGVSPYFCCHRANNQWAPQQERKIVLFRPLPPYTKDNRHDNPENGETLLHIAIRQQHLDMLQLLLNHGKAKALLSMPNNEYKTALELAQSMKNSAFYQAFVDAKLVGQKQEVEVQAAAPLPVRSAIDQQTLDSSPPAGNTRSKRAKLG